MCPSRVERPGASFGLGLRGLRTPRVTLAVLRGPRPFTLRGRLGQTPPAGSPDGTARWFGPRSPRRCQRCRARSCGGAGGAAAAPDRQRSLGRGAVAGRAPALSVGAQEVAGPVRALEPPRRQEDGCAVLIPRRAASFPGGTVSGGGGSREPRPVPAAVEQ